MTWTMRRAGEPKSVAFVDTLKIGQRFGRYSVVAVVWSDQRRKVSCRCDCGAERVVAPSDLKSGTSQSCGCLRNEATIQRNLRHGQSRSSLYMTWCDLVGRCTRPSHKRYADYGGRGIAVCERWRDFSNFLLDVGERPSGLTLDRIDNDGNYEPGNVRWTTPSIQNRNRRALAYAGSRRDPGTGRFLPKEEAA